MSVPSPRPVRIDAHQHFWHYHAAHFPWIDAAKTRLMRDYLPSDLEPQLRAAGFDACIAVQARQDVDETRFLLEMAAAHPFVAGVVAWLDLQADDLRHQLEYWAGDPKLVGIRHIVHDEPDDHFMLRPAFLRGLGLLAEFDLTYDLLLFPRHLPVAIDVVARFPDQRFVLDHLAKPPIRVREIDAWARDLVDLAAHPNVCAKLSGMVTEADWQAWTPADLRPYLDVALDCFGADRLMVGSDWPVCTLAGEYRPVMDVFTAFAEQQPAEDRDAILGGTAAKFWRLETRS
ncbi:MAG: amidohydrolase family protein [Acidobacteria bacterium]|nr:amidohydrolase family protein [Acidobacteriota bacterium]